MTQGVYAFPCPRCRNWLYPGALVCPACGGLVYSQKLSELANEAQRQETINPMGAAQLWQQCLQLLPADSQQYEMIRQRVGMLLSRMGVLPQQMGYASAPAPAPTQAKDDPLGIAILKTGVSMLISILIYGGMLSTDLWRGLVFAAGTMLLVLVHELGHVLAMRYYGLRAGPPIFIPFIGALINMRQRPKNALEEAVVGIAGPVLGTIGAIVCYWWYQRTGQPIFLPLAYVGFLLNLFNMLPVPPLDGGRITAAVSPWIWVPGLGCAAGTVAFDFLMRRVGFVDVILILVLLFSWPRITATLLGKDRESEYYRIGKKPTWAMGIAYVFLAGLLAGLYFHIKLDAEAMLRVVLKLPE